MGLYSEVKTCPVRDFLAGSCVDILSAVSYTRKGRRSVRDYANLIITADTETSYTFIDGEPVAWIYQWALCIYPPYYLPIDEVFKPVIVYGRTPSQMLDAFLYISDFLSLDEDNRAIVFFHNLSYDYEYLKEFIFSRMDAGVEPIDRKMLAANKHKIITYATKAGIEFRCSYILSNASLAFWAKKIAFSRHKKLTGAIDYDTVRYQDTPLKRLDWKYMFYDVIVPAECVDSALKMDGDTLASIPLTSTGYVRRDCRRYFNKDKKARYEFKKAKLSVLGYTRLKDEQSGGYTHTNRHYAGQTVNISAFKLYTYIKHRDMRSFYPTQMRVQKYPISRLVLKQRMPDADTIKRYKADDKYCHLWHVSFMDVQLKDKDIAFPIISASKCKKNKLCERLDMVEDNGRVLKCKGSFILTLTDQDLEIIEKQYDIAKMVVLEIWQSKAGYLPDWICKALDKYFLDKTNYKIESKKNKEDIAIAALLQKSKNRFNGVYGMAATDICKESLYEENGEWLVKESNISDLIDQYYESYNSFMWLQWGCWCTSWARYELIKEAECIGWKRVLYCDTDSLFYLSNDEIEKGCETRNKKRYNKAVRLGAFIKDSNGQIINYDAFEDEEEVITSFRALHSKCYGFYELKNGKEVLHITIAGVSARANGTTREQELGSLDKLDHGFVFHKCGGSTVKYYNHPIERIEINGHDTEYASGAIITKVDKTIKFNELNDEIVKYTEVYIEQEDIDI